MKTPRFFYAGADPRSARAFCPGADPTASEKFFIKGVDNSINLWYYYIRKQERKKKHDERNLV